jgi:hypothetical protein
MGSNFGSHDDGSLAVLSFYVPVCGSKNNNQEEISPEHPADSSGSGVHAGRAEDDICGNTNDTDDSDERVRRLVSSCSSCCSNSSLIDTGECQ